MVKKPFSFHLKSLLSALLSDVTDVLYLAYHKIDNSDDARFIFKAFYFYC